MARFRDWVDLGKSTLTSLNSDDVTNLYSLEWPETKKMLMAEHRRDIEQDPRAFRRWLRTVSAIFYGLAKKLAPHRRVLFAFAFLAFFICLTNLVSHMSDPPIWVAAETAATFMIVVLLLAMELIDKVKFRDELQLARDLQASLIPHEMPRLPQWEIAAFNRIANTVGGDIYDFVPLPDGRVAVLFGDASGHGMAAGLVMAVAHAAFRTQLEVDPSPAGIVASMNRILCRTGGPRSFFAFCYFLLSPDGTYQATIAGHPPALKIDNGGKVVERIGRGAYPLGVKASLTWDVVEGTLAPGERILLHSDGLTESRNLTDHEFGDGYVEVIAGWHPAAGAQSLLDSILGEWRSFMGRAVPDDDVSLTVIRRV
ncbi:MAG TPA: PP2C family protein-serine/threonine phosphatase [Thermoanaerobaculia bacterium]|nr:PP2C family protein-serine/threonine phosphatase [Thermoanaerobaculia bacterium]